MEHPIRLPRWAACLLWLVLAVSLTLGQAADRSNAGSVGGSAVPAGQGAQGPFTNLQVAPTPTNPPAVSYDVAFQDLHALLGREYPCFELKQIDWRKVGDALLPRARGVKTDDEFGLLCLELVARLEDSHSYLMSGSAKVPSPPFPQWDPGFACLLDDHQEPVIYFIDRGGPADLAGVRVGMTVLSLNGKPAARLIEERMQQERRYRGYSSERYLRYEAAQGLGRQMERGSTVALETRSLDGRTNTFRLSADLGVRYLPRLPVPIPGIRDSGDVSWTRLTNNIGYIYVRRIGEVLVPRLDEAVAALQGVRGLIVDVRGNSGGGFDGSRALRNFSLTDAAEPARPRFQGPMALLTDARCISAGEGWASWFLAAKRARFFGEATAGASSDKTTYTLKNGLFKVQYSVRPYTGFLNRPIERRGLEPDVPIRQRARDLADGRDTVLEVARQSLVDQHWDGTVPTNSLTSGVAQTPSSLKPLDPIPAATNLPGTLIFHGRYRHRSGGRDVEPPSELWLVQGGDGSLSALADLPFMRNVELASAEKDHSIVQHRIRAKNAAGPVYGTDLRLSDGLALLTRRGLRDDCDHRELTVPKGARFDPNTRPDSYCVANLLLRALVLKPGESQEMRMFDWDSAGEGLASYAVKIEHAGREKVEVPAGVFEANHLVLKQLTTATTWFGKRAGHLTDFWVLDNHIIVRVLRHREPYEMLLLDYSLPAQLPGR
jgi:carboxyl-terminal processing protease